MRLVKYPEKFSMSIVKYQFNRQVCKIGRLYLNPQYNEGPLYIFNIFVDVLICKGIITTVELPLSGVPMHRDLE